MLKYVDGDRPEIEKCLKIFSFSSLNEEKVIKKKQSNYNLSVNNLFF